MKKTKRSVFFILILLAIFSCSKDNDLENSNFNAQENFVELSQVKKIAYEINFDTKTTSISSKGVPVKSTKRTIKAIDEVKNEKGKVSFYVINYNEGGFILLSADKRTEPILGFSKSGNFELDEDSYPLGLKFWMKDAKKQITDIQNSNIQQSEKDKRAWELVENAIAGSNIFAKEAPPTPECYDHDVTVYKGPLLSSTWGQLGVFNDALQYINCNGFNQQVYAGCVPIAMAQVMKYYQYPTNYNWSSMPSTYATTTTANFVADIHDAIGNVYSGNPIYNCDGTGVSASANMGNVLKTQFNYSSADWANYNYNTVKSSINSNLPVILSGDNGSSGHMWVCDGYSQYSYYFADCTGGTYYARFHMNWGWNGSYDGYYAYNNFNPGNTNYNNNTKMIYNIRP